jgi:DNA-nicking Smr family endonuclease
VKKKLLVSPEDKKDWANFLEDSSKIKPKDVDIHQASSRAQKIKKLDLHGFSLLKANNAVENFIDESFDAGERKILVITGKGSRSESGNNPYVSEKLSVLKYSIPEFIKNNKITNSKVIKMSTPDIKYGGEGAIYIFLKNNKKL